VSLVLLQHTWPVYDPGCPLLSLGYDKKSSHRVKSGILNLQDLRYIQSTTNDKKLQSGLNLSLARALHVYGDHTTLLADAGIPPLTLTHYILCSIRARSRQGLQNGPQKKVMV